MSTRTPWRAAIIMLILGHVAIGSTSHAADDPADALLRSGAELRKNNRHGEALELFRKAHTISPSGRTLAQMGLAEFSLELYVDAETHLVGALADDSAWIAKNRAVLEQALADVRKHVARIDISGPAATEVTVNGKVVGRLPLREPVHVAEGTVRIEGTAPDHRPAALDLKVTGGGEFKAVLELIPIPASEPGPLSAPTTASVPPLAGAQVPDKEARWQLWVGGALVAISAAALTTGITWIAIDGKAACEIPSNAPTGSRCLNVYDTKTLGWISAGAGVVAAVAGGIVIWKGRATHVQVGMGPGTLTAAGRF